MIVAALLGLVVSGAELEWEPIWRTDAYRDASHAPTPTFHVNSVAVTAPAARVRVRLSNRFGDQPLELANVWFEGSEGARETLTLNGSAEIVIPPREDVTTDPISVSVGGGDRVRIGFTISAGPGVLTGHATSWANNVSGFSAEGPLDASNRWLVATAIERPAAHASGVFILGDSIAEGFGTTTGLNRRWSDQLAGLLDHRLPIANGGVNGALLTATSPCFGDAPETRLQRALSETRFATVIVALGINDLVQPALPASEAPGCLLREPVSAHRYAEKLDRLSRIAADAGADIVIATLPPIAGAGFWTSELEARREEVNRAIIARFGDRVLRLDLLLADTQRPDHLNPEFDSGDGVHPNDLGAHAIAAASVRMLRTH